MIGKSSIDEDFQCYIAYEAFNMAFLQKFYLHNKKIVIVEINNHYILNLDGFPK